MKLIHNEYSIALEFKENEVQVLTIEEPSVYAKLLEELCTQSAGGEGNWCCIENMKEIPIGKNAEIVLSPMALEMNGRKIIGKLQQELKSISDDDYYEEIQQINSAIVGYLDRLSMKVPYPLQYSIELDPLGIYKLYDVKIEAEAVMLAERISQYIQLVGKLCGVSLVIFVNLKSFLTDSELLELYKTSFYGKIKLLLIESMQRDVLKDEHHVLMDKQKCLIEF